MASDFTFTIKHIHNWVSFPLWPRCFILSGTISNCPPLFHRSILDTFQPEGAVLIFWCHIFLPFYTVDRVLGGENTGVGCHFLLQWTTFCQNSSLWPICLGWPCMAWLIFIELCKPLYCGPWREWKRILKNKGKGQVSKDSKEDPISEKWSIGKDSIGKTARKKI